ncbi:helix-turn-helix domain-containing protein [Saccharopolyspora pogona]|uniref:helix-turn-helix domain-containing protein n=1 Tax=Saccharopolyspora pogona TaxID=333966 RepID=UPI0016887414|nr:helix-turn-helix transcriptional regulator [Saccharopolyspora pogona]
MAMSPTVRSRRLGSQLRDLRSNANIRGVELAKAVGVSQSHLSQCENGRAVLTSKQLEAAIDYLEPKEHQTELLRELRKDAAKKGWRDFSDVLPEQVEVLIGLETEATWLKTFEGGVIPGLLQTNAYADAVISAATPYVRPQDIERRVDLRMRRQRRLKDPDCKLTAVIGEEAIRYQVGGRQVLRDQLLHIVKVVEKHDVTVQVVPFTTGAHPRRGENYMILSFPEQTDPEAVYLETLTSWAFREKPHEVRAYNHTFNAVTALALSPRESTELIARTAEELR